MSAITWSLSDERSGNFDGWGVVRGRLFKLGDRDMSKLNADQGLINSILSKEWNELYAEELVLVMNYAKELQAQNERLKAEAVASATEIDSLKAQLNNMERCYIDVKKERDDLVSKNEPKNKRPDPSTCIHEPVSCWLVVECAKCGVML